MRCKGLLAGYALAVTAWIAGYELGAVWGFVGAILVAAVAGAGLRVMSRAADRGGGRARPMNELGPLIHAPKRLRIMAILGTFDHVTFALVQERLGVSDHG